jgi:hypothetical protein
MWALKKILFRVDFSPSCVALTPYLQRAEQAFGQTAKAESVDVLISRPHQRDDQSFRRLRNLTYSLVRDSPCRF